MRIRNHYRYNEAKSWAEKRATAMKGVVCTASIGDYRLSIVWRAGKLRYHNWYVTNQLKRGDMA